MSIQVVSAGDDLTAPGRFESVTAGLLALGALALLAAGGSLIVFVRRRRVTCSA